MSDDESEKALQHSDELSIGVPEISVNLLPITTITPTRSPSILNMLIPKSPSETTTSRQYLRLGEIFSLLDSKFPQLKRRHQDVEDYNEISNDPSADMVEIEMPVVGNEFARDFHVDVERLNNEINVHRGGSEEDKVPEGYVEISVMPDTTSTSTESAVNDFQSPTETTFENIFETSSSHGHPEEFSSRSVVVDGIESKLMNSWEPEGDLTTTKPLEFYSNGQKSPMNVVIIINSRKNSRNRHPNCKQVHFVKKYDYEILPEYIPVDSDEDLFFKNEPSTYMEKRNQLKRAADGGFFGSDFSLTPAPRKLMQGVSLNTFNAIKKPSFVERLENESSIERSERLNKGLGNLMKFIAVWAHVDKFVSERARSVVKKLAYMSDDDYGDIVASPRRKTDDNFKNALTKLDDEPFT